MTVLEGVPDFTPEKGTRILPAGPARVAGAGLCSRKHCGAGDFFWRTMGNFCKRFFTK